MYSQDCLSIVSDTADAAMSNLDELVNRVTDVKLSRTVPSGDQTSGGEGRWRRGNGCEQLGLDRATRHCWAAVGDRLIDRTDSFRRQLPGQRAGCFGDLFRAFGSA
jgi:hypothetical protein